MTDIIHEARCGWVIKTNQESIKKFFIKVISEDKKTLLQKGINGMNYSIEKLLWDEVCRSNYE